MDCIFGITGNDYVILAADRNVAQSIVKMSDDDKKMVNIGEKQILGSCADVSVRKEFTKLVKANLNYNFYRYDSKLLTSEAAQFTRNMIWDSLRSRNPYQVATLIAGFDEEPCLYHIEQFGGMEKVTRSAIGYAQYFLLGLMDNMYKKNFTLDDGKNCIRECIKELKNRFLINLNKFDVIIIDKNGIQDVSDQFNN